MQTNISGTNITRLLMVLTLCLFISSCQQSPRKHYFLLNATPTATPSREITQTIGLGPIEIADYLKRSRLVRNPDNNRLQLTDVEHWGEPLEKGIARVLAINLMNQDSARLVKPFPWRSDEEPAISIRVHIYDLQVIDGAANINASWSLIGNESKTLLWQQHFVRSKKTGETAAQIAASYSELLAELAEDMRTALTQPQ